MARINTINAKEISKEVTSDFAVECRESMESMTVRLPAEMITKLKQLKADMKVQGHSVTLSDLIRSALQRVFGEC